MSPVPQTVVFKVVRRWRWNFGRVGLESVKNVAVPNGDDDGDRPGQMDYVNLVQVGCHANLVIASQPISLNLFQHTFTNTLLNFF